MAKAKRNVGQEILEGIRQLKHGEHGRVVKVPSVTHIRENTGLSQPRSPHYLECQCVPFRNGSKVVVHLQAQPEHCCSSRKKILAHS